MIQRLQSIFLLLASGSCFGLFGTDAADTAAPVIDSRLFADGSFNVYDDPILLGLFGLAGLIFLADIFLFKNRNLQKTMSRVGILAVIAGVGYGIYTWYLDQASTGSTPDFGLAFPVLAFIFAALAGSYIQKDEKLVRSADRLR